MRDGAFGSMASIDAATQPNLLMNTRFTLPPNSQNPFVQALSLLLGVVLLIAAFFVGAFLLVIVLSIAAVVAAYVMGRVWWLKRKFLKSAGQKTTQSNESARVIDVEYTVIDDDKDETP